MDEFLLNHPRKFVFPPSPLSLVGAVFCFFFVPLGNPLTTRCGRASAATAPAHAQEESYEGKKVAG